MQKQQKRSRTLQTKIYATLSAIFILVLVVSVWFSMYAERKLITEVISQQTHGAAESYFDSINVLMLSGTMSNRTTLQQKMLSKPGIIEARIIRGELINKVFGKGLEDAQPRDELDNRALNGEDIMLEHEQDGERVITVVAPLKATRDFRGTDCLSCHQVDDGAVLGAVRVSYSLADLDNQIATNQINSSLTLALLFVVGLLINAAIFRRFVISRIKRLGKGIQRIESDSDLTTRIQAFTNDEIGQASRALNDMLEKFQGSMKRVVTNARELKSAADHIAQNASTTASAILEQQSGTEMMAAAVNEMEATSSEVKSNAGMTAEASEEANQAAQKGEKGTQVVIEAINKLSGEISSAAEVIRLLDEKSKAVGSVLGVIKGIAEQTNLLALNAAIEAARAGESGRGFAVVADEVRALANKTQESAQEIEEMIGQLQAETVDAVRVMNSANESALVSVEQVEMAMQSLRQITGHVSKINELNFVMVNIADDQAVASQEISSTVLNISELAGKSSKDAAETAQLSETLRNLALELDSMVDQFKID